MNFVLVSSLYPYRSGLTLCTGQHPSSGRVTLRTNARPAGAEITLVQGEEIVSFPEESGFRVEFHGRGKIQTLLLLQFGGQAKAP